MTQRHATDVISLVFGTIFAGFTLVWLLDLTAVIDRDEAWLAGPVILIVAGAIGLVTALRPRRDQAGEEPTQTLLAEDTRDIRP
ncbi:MAG: hypothetical protein H0U28_00750 [Nocardioidaceae bacterium]|nr:hypothetical protein [Nocardioidaceae bacterium]